MAESALEWLAKRLAEPILQAAVGVAERALGVRPLCPKRTWSDGPAGSDRFVPRGLAGGRLEGRADRLDADRGRLVLRRADERVAHVVREPVHLRLREVERHPDEAGVDALADCGPSLELPAARDEPHPVAVLDSERRSVVGMHLDEG